MLVRMILLLTLFALSSGCETLRNKNIVNQLDESSKAYQKMLRWDGLAGAETLFAPKELREQFKEKVAAAQGVRVTDFRVKRFDCVPEQGEGTVVLDIEYYREPSITVRTVEDVQQWRYVEENKQKLWRLMSVPPDFP